jgi:hypothetical protein
VIVLYNVSRVEEVRKRTFVWMDGVEEGCDRMVCGRSIIEENVVVVRSARGPPREKPMPENRLVGASPSAQ